MNRQQRGNSTRGRDNHSKLLYHSYNTKVNATKAGEISFVALYSNHTCQHTEKISKLQFILDSGVTEHLLKEELLPYLSAIKELKQVEICIANGDKLIAKNCDVLRVHTNNNEVVKLSALIVKHLSFNLLLVRKINSIQEKKLLFIKTKQ